MLVPKLDRYRQPTYYNYFFLSKTRDRLCALSKRKLGAKNILFLRFKLFAVQKGGKKVEKATLHRERQATPKARLANLPPQKPRGVLFVPPHGVPSAN